MQNVDRRAFIGGSDARIIMGDDEAALLRLWREKRGEAEPEDLSGNLIVQLGSVTEELNRHWYERNTGQVVSGCPDGGFSTPSSDGWRRPWTAWSRAPARSLRPNSCCPGRSRRKRPRKSIWRSCSTICGSRRPGRRCCRSLPVAANGSRSPSPPIRSISTCCLTAEKKFWRCVETGETPHLFGVEPPRPRIEAVRVVDMSFSNAWAEFAGGFRRTRAAFLEHEKTKAELKSLVPEDAKEAIGHGVRARRSKSGAVSFDLLDGEAADAALQ